MSMDIDSLFPIPATDILKLKKLSHAEALEFLEPYHLDDDAHAKLLQLAAPPPVVADEAVSSIITKSITIDPARPLFICAAYLAGASQHQLANLFSIKRQTIYGQLRSHLPDELRNIKLAKKITVPQLEFIHKFYRDNLDELKSMTAIDLAQRFVIEMAI